MRTTNFKTKNRRTAYQLLKDAVFKKFKLNRSNVDAQDEKVCVCLMSLCGYTFESITAHMLC